VHRRLLAVSLLLGLTLVPARAPDALGQTTGLALVGATVITATGAPPIADAVILIRDGQIENVGPRAALPVPAGYRALDLAGKWITPGLIDSNIHLILTTVPEFFVKYEDHLTDIAIQSAQVGLKYGLTTMPDTWGPLAPLLEARDRINRGEFVGSRVLVAGNIVGTGGPFSQYFMGGWDLHGLTIRNGNWVHPSIRQRIDALWEDEVGPAMLAMTPAEAAATLRRYIAKGVDFVKIAVSGHSLGTVEPLMFSPAVLTAMTAEVRRAGIPLVTHTFTVESLRLAIEMAPDLLLHPNVMSGTATAAQRVAIEAMIETIADRGIYSALMAVPEKEQMRVYREWDAQANAGRPFLNRVMIERQAAFAGVTFDDLAVDLRPWLNSGVRYTLGTDAGPEAADLGPTVWGRLGRAHFGRMEGLVDSGADPMAVLIASTRHGAEAYGLGEQLGTIETGKLADLLVLDADPLADISNFRQIYLVLKEGAIIDRDALPTMKVLDFDPAAPWPY